MNNSTLARRYEGRLFAVDGFLFLIVEVDPEKGMARVSCRIDDRQQTIDLPITDVANRLATSANLMLDGINADTTAKRVVEQTGEWFFNSREGQMGPYESEDVAAQELGKYIICAQSTQSELSVPRIPFATTQADDAPRFAEMRR